jgi:hypothetical protein
LAWPVLFDAASIYTASNIAAANNIILPSCAEGQDPLIDKCARYVDLEADDKFTTGDNWALIQVSLWYDVAGTSFGTDFYFRVDRFSVSHGTKYPSVTVRGVEARAVLFNQSLINTSFDEGAEIEKVLKDLSEKMGYSVSWCNNTNSEPEKKRLLPRSIRFKGVTPDEAIKKVIDSVGGNTLSLPTREYANKISMCTRGEVQQGCSVFYLGKGLYEGYEINGQPDLTFLALNLEQGSNRNEGDQYVSEAFNVASYTIQNIVPKRRKKALEKVKKVKFPKQFDTVSPHIKGVSRLSGSAWKDFKHVAGASGGGATVTNERLKDVNMFGIAPNGTTAISFLSGKVVEADTSTGRVVINAKFFIQICDTKNTKKCFVRQIRQETTGLSSVKVKAVEVVDISQEIGSSTKEKPEFTRFFIEGFNNERVTLNPQLVWDWAVPEEELKEIQPPASPASATRAITPAPKASSKDWGANTTQKPNKVLLMAGHADFPSGAPLEKELNIELLKWAQRNSSAYGLSDTLEFYFASAPDVSRGDPRSQYSVTSRAVGAGKQVIEIHNDEANGKSGVIPPRNGTKIYQSDNALASAYGAFSINHRDGLGVPNRGGTILEVGRMDAQTTGVFKSGTSAQKEALYKQLMDPMMRAIAAERSRAEGTTLSPATAQSSGSFLIGKIGNTGSSRGAHLHAEWENKRPISEGDVRKYVGFGKPVVVTSPYRNRSRPDHNGIDMAANGDSTGVPMFLQGGASVVNAQTGCRVGNTKCGGWFGNNVLISTPEGRMILAHLQEASIPPNIAGMSSTSGGGKQLPNMQASPATQGLTLETSFGGVPRSLRVIPGRTILSLISDYDSWVEKGGPRGGDNGTDPGIWIPGRFKNWFVTQCKYKWRDGDLRVNIEGRSAWGTQTIKVPTFPNYISSMRGAGELKNTNDYFGYIRSIGDLHWRTESGKDSTEELCGEAQYWSQTSSQGPDSTGSTSPGDVQNSFPAANCRTGDFTKDAVINALYSAGLKTPNAFAGVLGNFQVESGIQANRHNLNNPGTGCSSTRSGPLDSTAYGIAQWCGSRQTSIFSKCGRVSTLACELSFMVEEIKGKRDTDPNLVANMNAAQSPQAAADAWNAGFERGPGGIQKRRDAAVAILPQIKCNKPTP